jgi:WD40 repeat protein/beta-lactamase regulating signal transducer with metallopeptidase domain
MPAVPFDAVASNLIVAALLAVVAIVVGRWANRPSLAHVLWLLVLVKLVTPPLFNVPVRVLPPEEVEPVAVETIPEPPKVEAKAGPIPEIIIQPQELKPDYVAKVETQTAAAVPPPVVRPFPWRSALLATWAAGGLLWLAATVLHVRRFAKFLRFATPAPDHFTKEVSAVASKLGLAVPAVKMLPGEVAPFVWSVGTTTLYFPLNLLDRLTPEQRATVVAHELAHVWRRDHLVRWIEITAVALYWWCPLAWFARRELRRLEEDCCDSVVVAAYPDAGPIYASAILDTIDFLATAKATPRFASAMGDVKSLRVRLTRILDGATASGLGRGSRLVLIAFAVVLLAAGPRLARLTAMALPTIGQELPTIIDTPFAVETPLEPVQYLPTPIRLKLADATDTIHAAALSPNGRFLAMATGNQVLVWDLETKRVVHTLVGHADVVNAVAFSPDGRLVASGSNDHTVKVWDLTAGTHRTLTGHTNWVLAVVFSPDGRTVASAGYDKRIHRFDLATGAGLPPLDGHTAAVRAISFSPDGKRLASASADQTVKLWNFEQGREERTLSGHAGAVRAVCFSPDGARVASGGEDRTVRVWNPTTGTAVAVAAPEPVTSLRFSAGGSVLFAGTFAGHVLNINPQAGKLRGPIGPSQPTHADAVTAVLPSPTGHVLFTVSHDGMVLVWPSAGLPGSPRRTFRGHAQAVTALALSADGKLLATGSADGSIRVWAVGTATEAAKLDGHTGGVSSLLFLSENRLLSVGLDERVRVWDIAKKQQVRTLIVPASDVKIALSPTSKTLAVTGPKVAGVMLWDIESGQLLRRIAPRLDNLTAVAFTPDGKKLALGTSTGDLILCQLPTGKEEQRVAATDRGAVDQIVFTKDGARAAVVVNRDAEGESAGRNDVTFWDVWTRAMHDGPAFAHNGRVHAVAFDPTETKVLTAGHDGQIYEWDLATGRRTQALHGHREAVVNLVTAADGKALVSAGDHVAKLWDWPPEKLP